MTDEEMVRAVEKVTEVVEQVGGVGTMSKTEYVEFLRALLDDLGDRLECALEEL